MQKIIFFFCDIIREIKSKFFVLFLKKNSSSDNPLWCLDIESGASTGWIATNWLEDLILHEYGPDIYDDWFKQIITSQNNEITLSILNIGKLIFDENTVYGGNQRIISKEFRNLPKVLLDDSTECFMSWSGHYFRYYIPEGYQYLKDYAVTNIPKINFENVKFGYSKSEGNILNSITLDFPGNKMTALVGHSGAGKSTILNLIPRFYDPQSGDLIIDNQSIYSKRLSSLRNNISLVSQETTLFDDTIRNNIKYAKDDATDDEIKELVQ